MNITEILIVILLISASALCIALIYFHFLIAKSVQSISSNFANLSIKINLFIDSAHEVSKNIDNVTNEIDIQLKVTRSIISDVREFANKLLNLETIIRDGIEEAVGPLAKYFRALGKGIGSFWKNYKK
ncbi:MAG: hypothetical protein KKF62_09540 [Bacteroidetes bacterium]|nr:hypothetical protein [Bacteroidota bacterium]MBU1114184.1 hypothetical protein [Bacteroidota bacterium]MBU1796946.1 hypothetical protein [Bacteroidota bacterium]